MSLDSKEINIITNEISQYLPLHILSVSPAKSYNKTKSPLIIEIETFSEINNSKKIFGLWINLINSNTWLALIPDRIQKAQGLMGATEYIPKLKNLISDSLITNIKSFEYDRSVLIEIKKNKNDLFLLLELFSGKPNLILTKPSGEVLLSKNPNPSIKSIYEPILKLITTSSPVITSSENNRELFFNIEVWNKYRQIEKESFLKQQLINQKALLTSKLKKTEQTIKKLNEGIEKTDLSHAKHADLLKLNLYDLKKQKFCPSLLTINDISITLNPALNWIQNMELLYRKQKKSEATLKSNQEELNRLEIEKEKISNDLKKFENISDEKIKHDVLIKPKTEKKETYKCKAVELREGVMVYIGRNRDENEIVTMQIAGPHDWWFHEKSKASAHAVLKIPKSQTPSLEDIIKIGKLIASLSKTKDKRKIEIDYTQKKFVKRIKSKNKDAFLVSYTNNKTIIVDLD